MLFSMMTTKRRASAIFVFVVCTVLFLLLAFMIFADRLNLPAIDNAVVRSIHAEATPNSIATFSILTNFGLDWLWIVVVIGVIWLILRRRWRYLMIWLFGSIGGQLVNELIKAAFNRARPIFDVPFSVALRASFPSGHAMMSTILYGLLAYLLLRQTRPVLLRALLITATLCWVGLIGFSRVFLGVHYPGDVIGGFLAGGAWLALCILLLELRVYPAQNL